MQRKRKHDDISDSTVTAESSDLRALGVATETSGSETFSLATEVSDSKTSGVVTIVSNSSNASHVPDFKLDPEMGDVGGNHYLALHQGPPEILGYLNQDYPNGCRKAPYPATHSYQLPDKSVARVCRILPYIDDVKPEEMVAHSTGLVELVWQLPHVDTPSPRKSKESKASSAAHAAADDEAPTIALSSLASLLLALKAQATAPAKNSTLTEEKKEAPLNVQTKKTGKDLPSPEVKFEKSKEPVKDSSTSSLAGLWKKQTMADPNKNKPLPSLEDVPKNSLL